MKRREFIKAGAVGAGLLGAGISVRPKTAADLSFDQLRNRFPEAHGLYLYACQEVELPLDQVNRIHLTMRYLDEWPWHEPRRMQDLKKGDRFSIIKPDGFMSDLRDERKLMWIADEDGCEGGVVCTPWWPTLADWFGRHKQVGA